jgi:signal transduction histidine kinase
MRLEVPEQTRLVHEMRISFRRGAMDAGMSLRWWFAALAMLWLALAAGGVRAQAVDLSATEQAWVKAHPVLRLGVATDYPPYYFLPPPPAAPHGFLIEMITLWAERLGLRLEITRFADAESALKALQDQQVDLLPFAVPRPGRDTVPLANLPVFAVNQVLVARRDLPDISPSDNFGRYRVAAVEGSSALAMLAERFPLATVITFPDAGQALSAVDAGNAELFIGYQQVVVYHVEQRLWTNVAIRRNLGPGPRPIGPTLRRDAVELRALLGKAISSVTAADRSVLAARWLPAGSFPSGPAEAAALTPAEREWVQQRGRVRIGYDAAFSPISRAGELGEPEGMAIDYLRLLLKKTGMAASREVGGAFADVYAQASAGELDVLVAIARTPERRNDFEFVGPFARIPTAIVMRDDDPVVLTDTREFGVRKVALLKQHFLIPELRARHPGIHLVELERQDQVLAALDTGAADVALGNVKVVNELIERRFAGKLRITGTVANGDSELYFGVRRNMPELTQVLRKGLDAISEDEATAIQQRWLLVTVTPGVAWRKLFGLGGPLLLALVGGLLLLWRSNRHMAQARAIEAQGRLLAEEASASRGRFLAYLSHELRGTLSAVGSGAELIRSDADPVLRERMLDAIVQSMRGLGQVLESTLAFEQTLAKPLQLQPAPVQLAVLWAQIVAPAELAARQKDLAFESRCELGDETVSVDAARLQQVVGNLLQNAVKFTARGSVQATARWGTDTGSRMLEVVVRDSGPGLGTEELERVFEPYAQGVAGARLGQGVGLGLAISRQIVNAMQGTLTAQSVPDEGATFTLRVPLSPMPA